MDQIQPNSQARRSRQNPVSCQLCRLKKLKCNRQQPCSNCSARGVGCQFATQNLTQTTTDSNRQACPAAENAGFQARLERLEDAVFGKHDSKHSAFTTIVPSPHGPSTPVIPSFTFNENEGHEAASKWLEGIGTFENSTVGPFSCTY